MQAVGSRLAQRYAVASLLLSLDTHDCYLEKAHLAGRAA